MKKIRTNEMSHFKKTVCALMVMETCDGKILKKKHTGNQIRKKDYKNGPVFESQPEKQSIKLPGHSFKFFFINIGTCT